MSAYAELAVTTNFSFLRGASTAEELVMRAKELGLVGLGIADRNTVAGVVRAHAMAEGSSDFKIAVGARLVFSDGSPDILAYPRRPRRLGPPHPAADRSARIAPRKAIASSGLPDLLEYIEGLNLIVMPPERINADALVKVLRRLKEASHAARSGLRPACFIAATTAAGWRSCRTSPTARSSR